MEKKLSEIKYEEEGIVIKTGGVTKTLFVYYYNFK